VTLIIAAGNPDQFIQVSDRRLTSDGVIQDDESNKAIVFYCANARLSVGFTGLARVGSFSTKNWILNAVSECAPPDYTAEKIIKRFTERATKDFRKIRQLRVSPAIHKRLSIMFTGYLYHHEPPLGALAVVSNFQNIDTGVEHSQAHDEFKCFFREERRPYDGEISLFCTLGTLPPIPDKDRQTMVELVKKRKPANAIVGKLVELIRKLSEMPASGNVIGKQLTSIILPRDRAMSAKSDYHSDFVKAGTYLADQILAISDKLHLCVRDTSMRPHDPESTPPMSGPKIKPKQPCWCGSGKKYKYCHGKPSKESST
jgi:hypothetical protein